MLDVEILPTLLLLALRGKCVLAILLKEQVDLSTLSSPGVALFVTTRDIWLRGVLSTLRMGKKKNEIKQLCAVLACCYYLISIYLGTNWKAFHYLPFFARRCVCVDRI